MTTIKQPCFADSSHWNPVDWNNLDPRLLGMIWKITQGKYYIDPTCAGFWRDAKSKGVARSVFHFFEPNDIQAQVVNFLTACEDIGIIVSGKWMAEIEPVLDAEYSPPTLASRVLGAMGIETKIPNLSAKKQADLRYPADHLTVNRRASQSGTMTHLIAPAVSGAQLAAQYKAWLDGVEAAVGIKPIIYTSQSKWVYTEYPTWASRYKLWTAQYPYSPDGQGAPLYVPYGNFVSWWGWQYSENATVQGFKGDINVYNGTTEEWIEQYGGGEIPPEPPGGDMFQGTVITASLNVRNAPSTGLVVNGLVLNNKVEADRIENGWWHLTKIRGAETVGENWAYEGATKNYIRTDAIIEPPVNEVATITVEHDGKTGTATIELT